MDGEFRRINGHPGQAGGHDCPLVIGSFSADLVGGKWSMKANSDDVFQPRDDEPSDAQEYGRIACFAADYLHRKTGFVLQRRPKGLGLFEEMDDEDSIEAIRAAITHGEINPHVRLGKPTNVSDDTGYDIVWPGD